MTAGVQLPCSWRNPVFGNKIVLGITSITAGGVNWNANAGASLYVPRTLLALVLLLSVKLELLPLLVTSSSDSGDDLVIGINADGTAGDRSEAIFLNIIDGMSC